MAEYDSSVVLAQRLINKKGREVKVIFNESSALDSSKPWEVAETQRQEFSVRAVVFPVESRYVDGSTVFMTDKQMLIAAADAAFPITPSAKVRDKGYDYQVIKVDTLEPGEQTILYTVVIR